jgi:lysozyme family protein
LYLDLNLAHPIAHEPRKAKLASRAKNKRAQTDPLYDSGDSQSISNDVFSLIHRAPSSFNFERSDSRTHFTGQRCVWTPALRAKREVPRREICCVALDALRRNVIESELESGAFRNRSYRACRKMCLNAPAIKRF